MLRRNGVIAAAIVVALCGFLGIGPASAATSGTQGVTATTIRVGVPYVNVAAVKAVGVNINWGNVPDAYMAIIANMNAHGGINGRRIVPYIVGVDPTGAAPGATTCTEMTQDDQVFVAIAPLQPTCYLQHSVSVINSLEAATTATTGGAQNFALTPPAAAFDPLQLSVFAKQGVFKNKKVGIFAGAAVDDPEVTIVQAELKKLHVPVVVTAVNAAPLGDLPAENEQVAVIAQRFQSDGVNEVLAVGNGSAIWPEALTSIQSTYNPPWVATAEGGLAGSAGSDERDVPHECRRRQPGPNRRDGLEQFWNPTLRKHRSEGLSVRPHQCLQRHAPHFSGHLDRSGASVHRSRSVLGHRDRCRQTSDCCELCPRR